MSKSSNRKEMIRLLADFSTIGMTVAFCIFIGVWIGYYLDHHVFKGKTTPWLTLFFLLVGVIAAFKNLFSVISRSNKMKNSDDPKN